MPGMLYQATYRACDRKIPGVSRIRSELVLLTRGRGARLRRRELDQLESKQLGQLRASPRRSGLDDYQS